MVGVNRTIGWSREQKWALREMLRRRAALVYYPGGSWVPAGIPVRTGMGIAGRPRQALARLEMLALERAGLLDRAFESPDDHVDARRLSRAGWRWARELLPRKERDATPAEMPERGLWISMHTRVPEELVLHTTQPGEQTHGEVSYTRYARVKK